MHMLPTRLILCLSFFIGGLACANPKSHFAKAAFVGVWEGDVGYAHWIIERRSDGTFTEKRIDIVDWSKPAIRSIRTGSWSVVGRALKLKFLTATPSRLIERLPKENSSYIIAVEIDGIELKAPDAPAATERRLRGIQFENIPLRTISLKPPRDAYPISDLPEDTRSRSEGSVGNRR
jgi:hypothetical protein